MSSFSFYFKKVGERGGKVEETYYAITPTTAPEMNYLQTEPDKNKFPDFSSFFQY